MQIGSRTFEQILWVLYAGRDANEVVRQAACCSHLGWNGGMAHVAGQADQGRDAAKADGHLEKPCLLHNLLACFHTAAEQSRLEEIPRKIMQNAYVIYLMGLRLCLVMGSVKPPPE